MRRGVSAVIAPAAVAAIVLGLPAVAQAATVTATGTGQARVRPSDRHSNSSIDAAYEAAQLAATRGAVSDARARALEYSNGLGLTLGAIESVSDQSSGGYFGPGPGFYGPFGPGQFCGTETQPVFKRVKGKRKVVGTKKVHRCIVPPFAFATLSVTYSAS